MEVESLIEFLGMLEKLKCTTRHSWTSDNRHESVAEHSWRLSVMALLLRDEFPELNMQKVLEMCLIHDWGEAITGDVPAFAKNGDDERKEDKAVKALLSYLPAKQQEIYESLFQEMQLLQTPEAKLWRALDKLEALIQHNEADTDTWLPLEHDLQQTYGNAECGEFPYTDKLRDIVRKESARKTAEKTTI